MSKTKQMWLRMASEGGRWKPKELADIGGMQYWRFLTAMIESGSVHRYGVTPECRIPAGVTLAELMEIGLVKAEAA